MKSTVAPYATATTCVRIECLNGLTVRLTAYPYDLIMSNGAVYKTDYGYEPTAFAASSAFSPSAMDLEGIVAVGGVTRDTLASGVFDNARVKIFKCNFLAPVEDYDPIAAGFFGKTTLQDDHYRIEGMSLVDALNQAVGNVYQAACSRTFGDAGCTINLASLTASGSITHLSSSRRFRDSSRSEPDDWFTGGTIKFTSGDNAGLKPLEIKSYSGGWVELFEPTYYAPSITDDFDLIPGCRKRETDCRDKYANIINFFGFTRIPTNSTYSQVGTGA